MGIVKDIIMDSSSEEEDEQNIPGPSKLFGEDSDNSDTDTPKVISDNSDSDNDAPKPTSKHFLDSSDSEVEDDGPPMKKRIANEPKSDTELNESSDESPEIPA